MNTHIIWYVKGWYGESQDVMDDLREIVGRWSMMDTITDQHVFESVLDVWRQVDIPERKRSDIIHDMFLSIFYSKMDGTADIKTAIRIMLSHLLRLPSDRMPEMEEKWDLDLSQKETI